MENLHFGCSKKQILIFYDRAWTEGTNVNISFYKAALAAQIFFERKERTEQEIVLKTRQYLE
jgi:hypothetical protein